MAGLNLIAAAPEVIPPGQQIDLFVESLVSAPLRDDRATMEFPFFALQKRPLLTPITLSAMSSMIAWSMRRGACQA